MSEEKVSSRRKFLLNIAYWAVILGIVFVIFKYLFNLLFPFVLASIFASVSRPVALWLSRDVSYRKGENGEKIAVKRKFRLAHNVAAILSVVALFLVLGGLLALIGFRIVDTVAEFMARVPTIYEQSIVPGLIEVSADLERFAARIDDSVVELVRDALPNLISSLGSVVTTVSAKMVAWVSSFATKLPNALLRTIICLIATVFIAVDYDNILSFIRLNLPEKPLRVANDVKNSFLDIVWQFIKSYFIIFCITATEVSVGLWIIGTESPVLIGILIAVFDAFPIVGSGMILLPWAIITLISGESIRGIGLLIVYLVVVIARQIIEPKIVGKHVGLRPLVTLVCMFAGTRLFGGIGLFGLPITAAIIADMNDSGLIHLYKHADKVPAAREGGKRESGAKEDSEL